MVLSGRLGSLEVRKALGICVQDLLPLQQLKLLLFIELICHVPNADELFVLLVVKMSVRRQQNETGFPARPKASKYSRQRISILFVIPSIESGNKLFEHLCLLRLVAINV